jgi:hypothetical protein
MRTRLALPLTLLLPLALAACGGGGAPRVATDYRPQNPAYTPPGPQGDPWRPYIKEASARFLIRETWIRAVMRQESGGHQYLHGQLTTSSSGAMGLMQLMPATYEVLRQRYNLGDDPYNPHDNIMAGTALIAELYVKYGSPGFLAAYNSSPRTMDAYLAGRRRLPSQTVMYVASVAPTLDGPSSGPMSAYGGGGPEPAPAPAPVEVAEAAPVTAPGTVIWGGSATPAPAASPPPQPASHFARFALIPSAMAEPVPVSAGGSRWGIQVGALASPDLARQTADQARGVAPTELEAAETVVGTTITATGGTLYRARLEGITHPAAASACNRLTAQRWPCLTVPPGG